MLILQNITLYATLLNSLFIIIVSIFWIKEHYFICSIEEWNKVAKVYNIIAEKNLLDCVDDLAPNTEAIGGYGFFKDQVEDIVYEEEE